MKIFVALVALLALVSSAMAWDFTDSLTYSYTKTGSQQAGDDIVLGVLNGHPSSGAQFYDPASTTGGVPAAASYINNKLGDLTVARNSMYTGNGKYIDLTNANFAAQLTQGGSAYVATHAINDESINALTGKTTDTTPEMFGSAMAYQNLALAGGFGKAVEDNFKSTAAVGVDGLFAITATGTTGGTGTNVNTPNSASVDAVAHGGGVIDSANLGESVTADVSKSFTNSAWQKAEYSGGIDMWANFVAADPGCANPIISHVNGDAKTSLFPTSIDNLDSSFGGHQYWGDTANPGGYSTPSGVITALTPFKG